MASPSVGKLMWSEKLWMSCLLFLFFPSFIRCEGEVRLVDGPTANEGRVEIYHNGLWGTVCDDSWGDSDARVVCRQLGYSGNIGVARSDGTYGQGSGPIYLDDVGCSGSESRLTDCSNGGWGNHDCHHFEDAGVNCGDETEGEVRLVDGLTANEGRVEIYHIDQWGTVCDDSWDDSDARVVCRQLGYSGNIGEARSGGSYGRGSGPIYLDDVGCYGYESRLTDCSNGGWGNRDCDHFEDAGVYCEDETEGEVRLVDGYSLDEGRVEIFYSGQWGTVCDDGWDDSDARVVCRQLGYSGNIGKARSSGIYGRGSGPIYLDDVACLGSESRLTDCSNGGWGNHDCDHFEDAGVYCEDSPTQPTVKASPRVVSVMASVGVCLSLLTLLAIIAVCWTCSKSKTAVTPRPSEPAIPLNTLSAHPADTNIQTAPVSNGNSGVACHQTMRINPHDANLNPLPPPY